MEQDGYVCFGLQDLNDLDELVVKTESVLETSASLCSNGKSYNNFGKTDVQGTPSKDEDSLNRIFILQYYYGRLEITDQKGFTVSLQLDKKKQYFPFVEMRLKSSVSLTSREVSNKCPIVYDECNF